MIPAPHPRAEQIAREFHEAYEAARAFRVEHMPFAVEAA